MPAYLVTHPELKKPRAVEADNPRRARAHVAKELTIARLNARGIFDLRERGIELVDITTKGRE